MSIPYVYYHQRLHRKFNCLPPNTATTTTSTTTIFSTIISDILPSSPIDDEDKILINLSPPSSSFKHNKPITTTTKTKKKSLQSSSYQWDSYQRRRAIKRRHTINHHQQKTVQGEIKIQAENGETRVLRSAPDWTESAILGDHIWVSTSTSGSDLCYVGENKCTKIGPRLCCPACKVTAHTGCISILIDNMKFQCKPTFKDGVRQYREQTFVKHHWVHRRHEKGRCKHCGKSFQSKLSFGNKEVVAVSCSWCKSSYHNKEPCFTKNMLEDNCDFGLYRRIIVPSSWIVKLPRKGSFKSSIRRTPRNKRLSSKKRSSTKSSSSSSSTTASTNKISTSMTNSATTATSSTVAVAIVSNTGCQTTNNLNVISITMTTANDYYPLPSSTSSIQSMAMINTTTTTTFPSHLLPPQSHPPSTTLASTINLTTTTTNTTTTTTTTTVMSESFLSTLSSSSSSSLSLPPPVIPPPPLPSSSLSQPTQQQPLPVMNSQSIYDNHHDDKELNSSLISDNNDDENSEQITKNNLSLPFMNNDDNISDDKGDDNNNNKQSIESIMTTSPAATAISTTTTPIVYTTVTANNNNRVTRHRRHSHANVTSTSVGQNGSTNLLSSVGCTSGPHHHHHHHNNHQTNPVQVVNNRVEQYLQHVHRSFVIKPIPSTNLRPLLVFINPKSGGNQGVKLMQKFQWHLNPRQVFDLSQGGPRLGLDLYKKVHNLRILACGGDGTAGWVLSAIDEIAIQPPPPISVLPLGTGNDLARAFGWGGSYTDEPIAKILCNIQDGQIVQLDRWNLKVQPNHSCITQQQLQQQQQQQQMLTEENKGAKRELPLNVVNNYFSIGVDAHIALSFHEAREAHPERFNSRLRNKMFYGQAGGKDLLQRKWKDLCNYVNLECDGKDYTGRLKELKVHSVLFLNIPSYGGGTRPWPTSSAPSNLQTPKTDDGYIEVIGLTTYQLPLLQAGGHGTIITQCRSAKIVTSRTIPMQVDGEPCRLLPSLINLELRNKANIVANTKTFEHKRQMPALEKITLKIRKLNLNDYETYHYDKEKLKEVSTVLGSITIDQIMELTVTAERFFRIDRAQEELYYVVDICHEDLFILDPQFDEKDDLDLFTSEEVIAKVVAGVSSSASASSSPTPSPLAIESLLANQNIEQSPSSTTATSNQNLVTKSLPISTTLMTNSDLRTNSLDLPHDDDVDNHFHRKTLDSIPSPLSPQQSPSKSPSQTSSLSDTDNNNNNDSTIVAEPYYRQMRKLDKLRPSNIDCTNRVNRLQVQSDNTSAIISPSKQNGNSSTLSSLSPVPFADDSPPKSPRRRHRILSPQTNRRPLLNQLMLAARNGDVSLLKHLHHKGVNLMLIDEKGMSALHYAVLNSQDEAVSFLANAFTQQMIDLAEPEFGHTALHKAIIAAKRDICITLVLRGARLDIRDNNGQNIEQLGRNLGRHDLLKTLLHVSQACNRETAV
ncbi:hypothetical protein DERF_014144 [Dermatophagoides farinae]|uniref:Diacylglycerol kinase n=1 Tax=Dermatophagoides farinae TaxID=6954 RepID=A0A922KTR3_DERFA|nr:hypothetical protein DERF_014144 [Dermatophagoides farinae]